MLNIIYVKKIIEGLMEYVQQNINSTMPEEDKFLYRLLNGTVDGNFDFYQQALKIYSRTPNTPNTINVVLEYPKDRTGIPCYVVREPGKSRGPVNTIGKIVGFYETADGASQFLDSRQSNYEIVCFSNNMSESILLSEVLYAMLVSAHDILAQKFDTIDYSMKELMIQNDLIPTPLFIRSIALNVSCDEIIPGLVNNDLLGKIIFDKAENSVSPLTGNARLSGLPGAESEIL
jgi:hypothetical protein